MESPLADGDEALMIRQYITMRGAFWDFLRQEFTEGYPAYSRVMFCPVCLNIWAKLTIEGQRIYTPQMVSCTACDWKSDLSPVPGSLIDYDIPASGIDVELLYTLPKDLLEREFQLTIKAAEKWSVSHETGSDRLSDGEGHPARLDNDSV